MSDPRHIRELDFIARLADAWDCKGNHPFLATGTEHRALLEFALLPAQLSQREWNELNADHRRKLIFAARRAIEFGRQCAWIFGEGEGAH